MMIQGVFCHETGCPNTKSRYDAESGEWVKQRKCFECGCTVDADDLCCNAEVEDEGCDECGSLDSANCTCDQEEVDEENHEDTDSLEDHGITLGSYAS
jgi:hypothetical protein